MKDKREWCHRCGYCVECCETGLICEHVKDNPNIKKEWDEEFEGSLSNFGSYEGGLFFCDKNNTYLEGLMATYLGVIDESYPHDKKYKSPKVKIKVRKGKIVIERI